MAKLTIDNKKIQVAEGATILDAATEANIYIPTLCYYKALSPWGGCRLCVVEVEGKKRLTASCSEPVKEGLTIKTNSERVIKARKLVLELLLARCPEAEEIKKLAEEYKVKNLRFRIHNKEEKCILCGLCVRICNEKMGVGAINFFTRGFAKKVVPPYEKYSEVCIVCGACETVCPTGAIDLKKITDKKPLLILSEFDENLGDRHPVYIPYPQAVPNKPAIDRNSCVNFLKDACKICESFCLPDAIDYDMKDKIEEIDVGAIILSSGCDVFDAKTKQEYGYGRYKNVITSTEFERILSASGPFEGNVLRPSDRKKPEKIAFIQCVGSRDIKKGNSYCSAICCMYTAKEAIMAKEHEPRLEATVFAIDVRAYGKEFEKYYERAKDQYGVRYVKSMISRLIEVPENNNLIIRYTDKKGDIKEDEFDLVVLAVGLVSSKDTKKLAGIMDVELNEYEFVKTETFSPSKTTVPGIFVGGVAKEPGDIPETVVEASSASAQASALLSGVRWTQTKKKVYPEEREVSEEEARIGVYICRCGRNIANVVDVARVVEETKKLENVVFAREAIYACSQDNLENIKKEIEEHGLNRVVVASCTPRILEVLFRDTIREAGLNKFLFEMANIRDQCSWVHMHYPEAATEKSMELVRMAVSKARLLKPLKIKSIDINKSALVLGGGLSGMTAALSIAQQGFLVHLVEKSSGLGGEVKKLYYNLERDNIQKKLDNIIERVKNNNNIKLYLESEIIENSGFTGNLNTKIKNKEGETVEIEHGALVVATGGEENKPESYLYGENDKILTQVELEEKIYHKEFDKNIKNVVMIQCVESRDDKHPYCSKVCCAHAIKNALKIKEINHDINIYILFRDIRTYGFKEKYYFEARDKGIKFVPYNEDNKPQVEAKSDRLLVKVFDETIEEELSIPADLVVLSTGIIPAATNKELSKILKLPLTEDGFFLEAHAKLRPLDFSKDGFYLCGLAHSPLFIDEAISQGTGASIRSATLLAKDKIDSQGITAAVNELICRGCGLCIEVCPYDARSIDEEKKVATINEILCLGCGACIVACPSGASYQKGFEKEQVFAMIEEVK